MCDKSKMSPNLGVFVAAFALFNANVCHAACSWGELEGKNYIKIKDTEVALNYGDVRNIGEVYLNECNPDSNVSSFMEADYRSEENRLLVWIDRQKLKEETPSGNPPHVICFFLKATNCDEEQWFEVEIEDTNIYDPSLLNLKGENAFNVTYKVSMPLLKGVSVGIDLLVKDIDLTNPYVNVSVSGNELEAVYEGTVDSLRKVHRFFLVPTDDLKFSERTFDLLLEDGGQPSRSSKAQLTLKEGGSEPKEAIFEKFYYEGTYQYGKLDVPPINYTNADNETFQLRSYTGHDMFFDIEVTPFTVYVIPRKNVEDIKMSHVVLLLVASALESTVEEHTVIFITFPREKTETERNCTGIIHVDNIENVNVNFSG